MSQKERKKILVDVAAIEQNPYILTFCQEAAGTFDIFFIAANGHNNIPENLPGEQIQLYSWQNFSGQDAEIIISDNPPQFFNSSLYLHAGDGLINAGFHVFWDLYESGSLTFSKGMEDMHQQWLKTKRDNETQLATLLKDPEGNFSALLQEESPQTLVAQFEASTNGHIWEFGARRCQETLYMIFEHSVIGDDGSIPLCIEELHERAKRKSIPANVVETAIEQTIQAAQDAPRNEHLH